MYKFNCHPSAYSGLFFLLYSVLILSFILFLLLCGRTLEIIWDFPIEHFQLGNEELLGDNISAQTKMMWMTKEVTEEPDSTCHSRGLFLRDFTMRKSSELDSSFDNSL